MSTQVELDHTMARGILPTVWTKEGIPKTEVQKRELELSEAAGFASPAVKITGAYIVAAGMGTLDPITNWSMMSQPKALLTPRDIRLCVANIKGRLKNMIEEAESNENNNNNIPAFSPANFHPLIWHAAAPQWTIHQYRIAVSEAATALTNHWREKLGRSDADGTSFWQQSLSVEPPTIGRPKIVWPGEQLDKTVKSMKTGLPLLTISLKDLAAGLTLTVRNSSAHARKEVTEQEGMEQLAAYSLLARLLDQCEVRFAKETETDSAVIDKDS